MSHFPANPKPLNVPTLIIGAKEDIIYPPHLLSEDFMKRFPKATHIVINNQAHCFKDPGWQDSILNHLVSWLNIQADDNYIL